MSSEQVKVDVNVSSNGTTDAEIKKAGQLNTAFQQVQKTAKDTAAYKNANAATGGGASGDSNYARGVTGSTGAAGRDFAAQAQGLGGLVHVYATFAANIFAVSAAFTALSKAADFELMTKGLDQIGAASGRNLGTMAKRLIEITDGAVNLKTALTATAQANAAGITADQLSRLAAVAATASHALGRDLNESMERLLMGVTKNQPKLLDELGIIVHVGKAASDYAQALGKSVTALTEFEKNQSFVIAAIKQGESKFKDITIAANPYSKLLAEVTNQAYAAGAAFNTILGPIAKFLGENPAALGAALAGFTALLIGKAIPALTQWQDQLGKTAQKTAETAHKLKESYSDFQLQKDLGPGFAMQKQADAHKAAVKQILEQNKGLLSPDSEFYKKAMSTAAGSDFTKENVASIKAKEFAINKELAASQELVNQAKAKGSAIGEQNQLAIQKEIEARKAVIVQLGVEAHAQGFAASRAPVLLDKGVDDASKKAKWYEEEAVRARNSALAETAASKARLLKALSDESEAIGRPAAFAKFRESIKNDDSLNKFNGFLLTTRGAVQSTLGYIGNLASSLGNMFMIVGIGVAAFEILDTVFSKNTKAITDFKSSLQYLNDAVDGAQRTIDFYAKNSGKAFSSEGIIAYANAFNEVSSSIDKVALNLVKVKEISGRMFTDITKNNWWERLGDETAALFGGGIQKNAAKSMANALGDAVKLAGTGPQAATLQKFISDNLSPKTNNIQGYQDAINKVDPEFLAKKFETLAKGIAATNLAINNTASDLKEYNDSAKIATDAQDKYLQSLSNNDPLFKFGAALQTESVKLSKAIQDPTNALAALLELSKDFDKLSLLPTDTAMKLGTAKKDLQDLQDRLTKLNASVMDARAEVEKTKGKTFGPDVDRVNKDPSGNYLNSAQSTQDYANAVKFAQGEEKRLLQLRADMGKKTAEYEGEVILASWTAGSEKIKQSLKYAEDSAGIALAKNAISGLSGSGTAEANAILAKQEIDIQIKLVQAQKDALASQETLRLAIENQTAQLIIDSKTSSADDKTKATKRIALNTAEKDAISNGVSADSIKEKLTILGKGNIKDKDTQELIARFNILYQRAAALESRQKVLEISKIGVDITAEKGTSKEDEAQRARLLQFDAQELNIRLASLNTLKGMSPIFNEVVSSQIEFTQKALEKNAIDQKGNELLEIRKQAGITNKNLVGQELVAALARKGYAEQYGNKLKEIAVLQEQQAQAELVRIHLVEEARIASIIYIAAQQERINDARDATAHSKLDVEKNNLEILKNYGTISETVYAAQLASLNKVSDTLTFNASMRKLEKDNAAELLSLDEKIRAATQASTLEDPTTDPTVIKATENKSLVTNRQSEVLASNQAIFDAKQKIIDANNVIAQQTGAYNDLLKTQTSLVDTLTMSFGTFGTAIGGVLTSLTEGLKRNQDLTSGYSKQLSDLAAQKQASIDMTLSDPSQDDGSKLAKIADSEKKYAEDAAKARIKYNNDVAVNEDAMLAKSANSLKKNFAEKTAAFKVLDAVEKAASTAKTIRQGIEMAMTLKEMVITQLKTMAVVEGASMENAAAASTVEEKINAMLLSGGEAVLEQGKGDPYSAFVRMAAMAAFVATIISSFGGGGKGSVSGVSQQQIDAVTAENVQKTQNTGGVLGDSTATSNSLKKGIEELSKNSFSDLDYTQEMLKSLKSIDKGISQFGVAVARATGIQGTGPSKFGVTDGATSTTGKGGFIGIGSRTTTTTTNILDTGVRLVGSIGDFLKGVGKIVQYETDLITVVTKSSGFWGIGGGTNTDKQINTQTVALEDTTQKLVSKIIGGMVTSISDAFKLLQLPTENLIDLLSGVDVTGLAASLKGLSGQAASDAIDAFFSNIFDKMSEKVAPWIGEFQKVGESMGDTLIRLASDTRTVDYAYISLGVSALDAAKASKAAGVSIEEWVIAQTRANENLLDLAGGLDAFVSKMDYITQNFLTDSQKLAPVRKALTEAFSATGSLGKELAKVGLATPTTRAQFVTLLTTLRGMGEAGNAATAALLDIAPAFNKIQGAIEDLITGVGQRITDMEFQMTLDTLDTQGKYALINKTAGEDYTKYMAAVNDSSVSTADAAKLANKLIDRIQQGWNLLTTEQRQEAGVKEKYFKDLDEINATLTAKGGAELLGLSNDTISLISSGEDNTTKIVNAINSGTATVKKDVAVPIQKMATDTVVGNKLVALGDTQQISLDKAQQAQDMKMIQSQTNSITLSDAISRNAIAKAMNSSAQLLYGASSDLTAADVQSLVDATAVMPQQIASAVAATTPPVPVIDVSGIQATVDDLSAIVSQMLANLVDTAQKPVNLNVKVNAPRNQEVGVSFA